MSEIVVVGRRVARWGRRGTETVGAAPAPNARRVLQLALAGVWLLDGLLQCQPAMFGKAFGESLAATAPGNPGIIARPIAWDAALVEHHAVALNAAFATIQLGVWWLGEGLGGVLNGTANPVSGAPGAVILYALLAVLLWPADRAAPAPFTAARAVGARAARVLWLVLWLSLAWFALQPADRAPQALHDTITGMAGGEPGWLAAIENHAAALAAGQGLAASIALGTAFMLIAIGVYLPARAARTTLVLAVVMAAVIWVIGEAFGMILAGGATDPNSGPLLALLAVAYWPAKTMTGYEKGTSF